jgi:hypothetical protein
VNTDPGIPADLSRQAVAETICQALAADGVDLSHPEALAGFLGAAAAILARVADLTEKDRAVHTAATDNVVDALIQGGPEFWAAWDASLTLQTALMRGHRDAGNLSEDGYQQIFAAAVAARHLPGAH